MSGCGRSCGAEPHGLVCKESGLWEATGQAECWRSGETRIRCMLRMLDCKEHRHWLWLSLWRGCVGGGVSAAASGCLRARVEWGRPGIVESEWPAYGNIGNLGRGVDVQRSKACLACSRCCQPLWLASHARPPNLSGAQDPAHVKRAAAIRHRANDRRAQETRPATRPLPKIPLSTCLHDRKAPPSQSTPCGKQRPGNPAIPRGAHTTCSKHVLNAQVSIRSPCCGSANMLEM